MLNTIMTAVQFWLLCVMCMYFYSMVKTQRNTKSSIHKDACKELESFRAMQKISLTEPLAEKTRPKELSEIIGQKEGVIALKAALCSKNPQHVIIYGPPGVGKTAAARTVLEEAIASKNSPFGSNAKFVEMDATTLRFDERSIADPLMGSVHDPIYQGAGAYGPAGIPQPKAGAVTKAHGGILFLDEIGELHPVQMNKLLKVLEDRKVFFESAYYAKSNREIPLYIHEIFQKGMPADFRLVAATTAQPEEIPPALRSRCTEIYFNPLKQSDVIKIAKNAVTKSDCFITEDALELLSEYADNGRDAVNMIQVSVSYAALEKRTTITKSDIEWVVESGHYISKPVTRVGNEQKIGCVNGLAVISAGLGAVMKIEATATPCAENSSKFITTGIVENETVTRGAQKLHRSSTVNASIKNAVTLLSEKYQINFKNYRIHLNFPGGMPVDGPSAGVAIFVALYSAILKLPIREDFAFTGEISIFGNVLPVGGVSEKISAAKDAGVTTVYIPSDNDKKSFHSEAMRVISCKNISDILEGLIEKEPSGETVVNYSTEPQHVLTAEGNPNSNLLY